jgi:hypothetical protein
VSSFNLETPDKVLLQAHPFAIMADFSAPGTDPKQPFQIVQTGDQAARKSIDDPPNKKDQDTFDSTITPINDVDLIAEEPVGQVTKFIKPGKAQEKSETGTFIPQDA